MDSGEFLWLTSFSDLMILLFIFFILMFSFTQKRLRQIDVQRMMATLRNEEQPEAPTAQMRKKLSAWAKEQKLEAFVEISEDDDGLVLQMRDNLLFGSGDFHVNPVGSGHLRSLTAFLDKTPKEYKISIEGHTDDSPMHSQEIEDNWALSAKRALAVFHSLRLGAETQKRTLIVAHGDTVPLVPNRTPSGQPIPENQGKNRRVTFRILQ